MCCAKHVGMNANCGPTSASVNCWISLLVTRHSQYSNAAVALSLANTGTTSTDCSGPYYDPGIQNDRTLGRWADTRYWYERITSDKDTWNKAGIADHHNVTTKAESNPSIKRARGTDG